MRSLSSTSTFGFIVLAIAAGCAANVTPSGSGVVNRQAASAQSVPHGARPAVAPTAPIADGDTFEYANTSTDVIVSPSQPPLKSRVASTETETVAYPVKRGLNEQAYELAGTEVRARSDESTAFADFAVFVPAGPAYALAYFAEDETFLLGNKKIGASTSSDDKPYDIVAEYPETVGLDWSNNFSSKFETMQHEAGFKSSSFAKSQANGAYVGGLTFVTPSQRFIEKNDLKSDGTGSLSQETPSHPRQTYTFGLPFQSGDAEVIPVETEGQTTDVPDWYPNGGQPAHPPAYASVAIVSLGETPATCGAQAKSAAYDIRRTGYALDPTSGTYLTEKEDLFDSPTAGMICSTGSILTTTYDELSTGEFEFYEMETFRSILTGRNVRADGTHGLAPLRPMRSPLAELLRSAARRATLESAYKSR
jgi:hypothetical protein